MSDERSERLLEEIGELFPTDKPPVQSYPEDRAYRVINIRVKLEDEDTLKYSVTCPEWKYCIPTVNPHEIARQVIKCTMMHNINVIKGGDDSVEVPI